MKLLTLEDLNVEDTLRLSFDGSFNHHGALERELEPFLQGLELHAGDWMPDVVKGNRQRSYSRDAVVAALKERRDRYGSTVGLYRTAFPAVSLTIDLGLSLAPAKIRIWLDVQPISFFSDEERCQGVVKAVRGWGSMYPVPYAVAHSAADRQLADFPRFGRDDETCERHGTDTIYDVFWLNIFGPKLVESIGLERMLSTPAHLVEELPNGSVLLVLRPTAADFASDEARVAQARAHVHLRPDLDFDTVLRTLKERSAALSPVEPRFHPDLAPLLSRLPDEFAISERQQKIAELNAFRPPSPEEWLPAALPSDVENPERVLASYGDLSEGLVAALHTKVPSIMEETPESLTDLDFHFWRENFPERYTRELIDEHTAPALGAYLGDVLVRRLGGTWVPRQKLEESQVRVGRRVWLPFLRARRYMQSRQSLLDYSLTLFLQEVKRHCS
ncbi:hypothetical protein [Myxococcus vastator]|uniref:hypothetical protein n=1 Tax=Myxococcus vastator TaxID=2709664 RepID=UPI0013D7B50C|nr:hypothetical protein [Myxococcus vastator]